MSNGSCRITVGQVKGHRAVALESDVFRLTVLPDKGADIYELIYKPESLDFLWKNPLGLAPPGAPPQEGSGEHKFLWNYEGAWQELFPSAGGPSVYNGREIPFHGEVALLPWDTDIVVEEESEVAMRFAVTTQQTPFKLERIIRVKRGESQFALEERVTNTGNEEAHFNWGHHCVLGEPFLEAGCKLLAPAQTIVTAPELYEETARLVPGQREPFPMARTRDGDTADLREIPGRDAHTHDDAYLTDLTDGWVAVTNPKRKLTFSLHWDVSVFKWIINWQVYGGAEALPFKGLPYCIGIEPWISDKALGEAAATGDARSLAPGASLQTELRVRVTSGEFEA